jgi:hypothetical protein
MKARILATVFTTLLLTGFALTQMRGSMGGSSSAGMGGAPSMGRGQSSMGGMQGGAHSGMGGPSQGGTSMTPMQRRQLMHTTSMQNQKYQVCSQAMSKVQGDLSHMRVHRGQGSSADASSGDQQEDDSGDSLSSDLADLSQSDDDLSASLNSDQQAVLAAKIKDLHKKTKEMQALAQQLKATLANSDFDPKLVKAQVKRLNKLGNEVTKEQHEIAAALGISADV